MVNNNSEVKVYGPYDFERKERNSPYITIFLEKRKAKVTNSNTEIHLEEISPNFFASKQFTFEELKIIDEACKHMKEIKKGDLEFFNTGLR